MKAVSASIFATVSPEEVIGAFLEFKHLQAWWGVEKCLIETKPGGAYSLAWGYSEKGIQYISSGTIAEIEPGSHLFLENMVYFSPYRQILGPMGMKIITKAGAGGTDITVHQDGYQEGGDWDWYYEAVKEAWPKALETLKIHLENTV